MATTSTDRIETLDVIRGVAVMGILLANLPAFALPESAYFSPLPWGGVALDDRIAWALTYVFVEGKMRGLFTLLFGASMLLVMDRARAAGESAARVHYSRMIWLFVIGCLHLYLLWWGDILAHYALVGSAAFLFARVSVRKLVAIGALSVGLGGLFSLAGAFAAFGGGPGAADLLAGFGAPDPESIRTEIAATRGAFRETVRWRWEHAADPFSFLIFGGPETLGYMLWGMAGLKSGFLTGAWDRARYLRWATWPLLLGWAAFAALAWLTLSNGFDPRYVFLNSIVTITPVKPFLVVGYAALVVLAMRPGGWLTERVAAAGRAAFTNYLGTTVLMTFVFSGWGLGLFASIGRAEMYWLALLAWAIMLAWSKPWLERYRFGPLEWAWRSLSRLRLQQMRKEARAS